jgi:glycosyltransferase involved in cell wall biosynthesis
MTPRRVLVVAYYFPPLGGSGVQRVAKLVKYLPEHGWQPTVLTARPGAYVAFDPALAKEVAAAGVEVVATRTLDPTRAGQGRTVAATGARRRWLAAITDGLFVPDNKLGWAPFALREGAGLLHTRPFDAVYATAPPYTGLLVAARLARRFRLPLYVDLRDDWLGNPRHRYPTPFHRRLHAHLERRVLRQAVGVSVISEAMRVAVVARHPDLAERVRIVPQGFDPADFDPPADPLRDGVFRLLYSGMFYDAQRPDTFLAGLRRLRNRHPEARVEALFAGLVPPGFDALVDRLALTPIVRYLGYLSHADVTRRQQQADVLWMTVGQRPGAEGISTGKLFEYMGTRKPILGLVPDGTAAEALRAYGAGIAVPPDDPEAVGNALELLFGAWQAGAMPAPSESFVMQHDRQRMAGEVAAWLENGAPERCPGTNVLSDKPARSSRQRMGL